MTEPAVIIGLGEMGGVFARALLRVGSPIFPVVRTSHIERIADTVADPSLALVAVGEADLDKTLADLPGAWRSKAGLVQNELLPPDWEAHDLSSPTVAVVWFEKKPGQDVKVIIPSPIAGPAAGLLIEALDGLGIPAFEVQHGPELLYELVRKNLYILTANIAGLVTGGSVGELWNDHREQAQRVADEILSIQEHLAGLEVHRSRVVAGMEVAFEADPGHKATGRSAPTRLARALTHARDAMITVDELDRIADMTASPK